MLTSTVVSYPDRGPWGDNQYGGNCSGHLIKDLIEWRKPAFVYDPMAGSGTTGDVCDELGIPYLCTDIGQRSAYSKRILTGTDVLNPVAQMTVRRIIMEETEGRGADMIFLHPPYYNMVRYTDKPTDLGNGSYGMYLRRMGQVLKFLNSVLSKEGFIGLLLADLRKQNMDETIFLTDDVTATSTLAQAGLKKTLRIIKVQHNTRSNGEVGLGVKMAHEYLTILEKR